MADAAAVRLILEHPGRERPAGPVPASTGGRTSRPVDVPMPDLAAYASLRAGVAS